ncbi:methyltransferase domain-containing protein [Geomonas anaerohicana]|uniref:Methyltransferase domain-containing protein n=1 Tax=Geomonas anaerohicana TaxID=2798583 RepID=A0ABS0YDG4_9BACT|nr:methyltransferase domain-containing protein [Geomonas anaerohicana]MBJ6750345.1 methyltransferase domain-containing protein [Geomonas anaerohicana]
MHSERRYLMEHAGESLRLDMKTDNAVTERQARWAGLTPGMSVIDIGCGPGKTTSMLGELVQPGGRAVGVDLSEQRLAFAREHYGSSTVSFERCDLYQPLTGLGQFDFAWCRFVLEYHLSNCFELVRNIAAALKPGGILCLIDLDHNCLSHFGHSPRMERAVAATIKSLEENDNFDPYVGRKLYSFLYDLGFQDIDVKVEAHHQIFGELKEVDEFNWTRKVEVAAKRSGYDFNEYEGGYEEFLDEFRTFFANPRRFTYTPIISCRGRKPQAS